MMAAIHSMHSLLSLVVAVVAVGILVTTAPVHSYVVGDHHHQNHNGHNNNNSLSIRLSKQNNNDCGAYAQYGNA